MVPGPTQLAIDNPYLFRAVVEHLSDPVCLVDSALNVVYASPSLGETLGFSTEDVLGQSIHEIFQPEARTVSKQAFAEALDRAAQSHTFECWARHQDGGTRWVQVTISNRLHDAGMHALLVTCRDLTEQKRKSDSLAASEEEFRSFFECIGVGSAEIDPVTTRFVRVNRKLCEILGFTQEEMLARTFREFTHPDDAARDWTRWEQSIQECQREYTTEKRLVCKRGGHVWVQVTSSIIRDSSGTPVRATAIIRDVTDRRHAIESLQRTREQLEQRVARRTAELATANQRLESLIAAAPLSIISLDPDLIVRRWNPASEQLFGWREDEVIGKPLPILPSEDHEVYEAEVRHLLADPGLRNLETVSQHRDGELLDVSIWRAPLYEGAGTLTGSMAILMDVTERKRLERALLDASEREQRRIGQDLHDHLCQHLLGVACVIKALAINSEKQNPPPSADLHHAASLVNQSVQQTRDIARGLHPVELDAEGLMAALRDLAHRSSAVVPCELQCKRPVLVNDTSAAMHFYRIAQEAVANALKHAHASQVIIRLSGDSERILLEILDDGRGIKQNGTRGQGMGLDIMKYRAHAIGGRFLIETQASGGTRVACSIPKPK